MGWLYTDKPKNQSVREFFEDRYNRTTEKGSFKILACATKAGGPRGPVAYMAAEVIPTEGERCVFAMIYLLDPKGDADGRYNFGYKDMDETCGPIYYDCPASIMKLLTPTENAYALQWRANVYNRLNEKTSKKAAVPKLKVGDVIALDDPLKFPFGEVSEITVTQTNPLRILAAGHPARLRRETLPTAFAAGKARLVEKATVS